MIVAVGVVADDRREQIARLDRAGIGRDRGDVDIGGSEESGAGTEPSSGSRCECAGSMLAYRKASLPCAAELCSASP